MTPFPRFLALAALAALLFPAALPAAAEDGLDALSVIRPGLEVETPVGYCSLNFVWRNSAGDPFIGTAGHCGNMGHRAKIDGTAFGTIVFDDDGSADFALIKVDANKRHLVQNAVAHWNGPTAIASSSETSIGEPVVFYGYGMGFGFTEPTRARQGVIVLDSANSYSADMPAVNGDSGGPILLKDSGKAYGIISHYGLPLTTDAGPTVSYIQSRLDAAGMGVTLATAPYYGNLV